jgi:hypothetical protein
VPTQQVAELRLEVGDGAAGRRDRRRGEVGEVSDLSAGGEGDDATVRQTTCRLSPVTVIVPVAASKIDVRFTRYGSSYPVTELRRTPDSEA